MTINIISCVTNYNNKLAIGRNGSLLFKLSRDLKFFKTITTGNLDKDSKIDKNVVLMGRKTWFSIQRDIRPLKNRLNLVLTNDVSLLKLTPYPKNKKFTRNMYFITFEQFLDFYRSMCPNVFVIGGSEIYGLFINSQNENLLPSKIYLTEVYNYTPYYDPDAFFPQLNESYKLTSVSQKYTDIETYSNSQVSFRFLEYRHYRHFISDEHKYLDTIKHIFDTGNVRDDRTGVGTVSVFGHQITFDISESIPLLTTKRVPWRHCIEELLWFMRGDTDAKLLQKKGIKIWDGNTSREFLDSRGLYYYQEGILGPGYGWQWRFFGAKYSQAFADTSKINVSKIDGFDQLAYIEHLLKTDPFSRRIMMSYWNPPDFEKTALLPCHFSCQFYVVEKNNQKYLSCMFNMRSNDFFLGNPFNIFSYAVLTYILAKRCNMKPDKLIYSVGDVHIYKNHFEQVAQQLARTIRPFPILLLNDDIRFKSIKDITINDFDIVGYYPHPSIKAPMAI